MKHGRFKYGSLILIATIAGSSLWDWSTISSGFSTRHEPSSVEAFVVRRVWHLAIPERIREITNLTTTEPEVVAAAMEQCRSCLHRWCGGTGKTIIYGKNIASENPTNLRLLEVRGKSITARCDFNPNAVFDQGG